jgi:hypothetical protein
MIGWNTWSSWTWDENAPPYVPHYRFQKSPPKSATPDEQIPEFRCTSPAPGQHVLHHPRWMVNELRDLLAPHPDAFEKLLAWLEQLESRGYHFRS